MPAQLTRMDLAELAVVAIGVLVILSALYFIHRRRMWADVLQLPSSPPNVLEPVDLLFALAVVLILPSILYRLLSGGAAPPTPSGPSTELSDSSQVLSMTLGQAVGILLLLLLGRMRFLGGAPGWGLKLDHLGARCLEAFGGYLAVWPICFGLLHLSVFIIRMQDRDFVPPEHSAIRTLLSGQSSAWMIVVTILSAAILAPILEELFFRGILQPFLIRWTARPWPSIVLTGIIFGFFHYPLIHTIPALAVFGIFLGYLYAKTRSLTLVILLHVIFNGKTLLWLALGVR